MKVALLHDWIVGYRGGERMLEAFCELYPKADIYTLFYQKGSSSSKIESHPIYTSWLNSIPGIYKYYRFFLPLLPLAAETLCLRNEYDLIISSSHCVIKGVRKNKKAFHLSYVYSPMRYMYDQFDNYFGPQSPWYQQLGARFFRSYLTNWDLKSNENVDEMVGISNFVGERIQKFYGLQAKTIYPFVEVDEILAAPDTNKQDFYVMVTAFAPNKRCDLAIHAFNQNGKKLKIIGGGQQDKALRALAHKNIEFLGVLPRSEVIKNLKQAKGFIFPGVEDFGIAPLESLAAGTPVIAYAEGGALETLTKETAEFFADPTPESLNQSIEKFEARSFLKTHLIEQAQVFSKQRFIDEVQRLINKQI